MSEANFLRRLVGWVLGAPLVCVLLLNVARPMASAAPGGVVDLVVVSLPDQAFAAFSNGERVMRGPICSGMGGYETRTGAFRVTSKHEHWVSTIYGVPMPHFLRLNGSSMGLHGGYLPGFAASHGCVRLTFADAATLFGIAPIGTRVVITGESTADTKGVKQPRQRVIYYRVVRGKKVILSDSEAKRLGQIKSGDPARTSSKGR
ncbi:MAG TPA: L,D-transpeptidase [Verrucomicrobiae bacterium]|nr:L,D-transpeptidase [Verrucomicrobiae bacterium]